MICVWWLYWSILMLCPKYDNTMDLIVKTFSKNHSLLVTDDINITLGPYHGKKWKSKLIMEKNISNKWINSTPKEDIFMMIKDRQLHTYLVHCSWFIMHENLLTEHQLTHVDFNIFKCWIKIKMKRMRQLVVWKSSGFRNKVTPNNFNYFQIIFLAINTMPFKFHYFIYGDRNLYKNVQFKLDMPHSP